MMNFWPPLIGGIIGGGLGFFVAEIVRRQIRHHTRIEGDRDEELRIVSGAIDDLRSLAIDYWKRDRIADEDALLEAAIIGRSAPLNSMVVKLFADTPAERKACNALLSDFDRAMTDGDFLDPARKADMLRLRRIEQRAADLTVKLRHHRKEIPRKFWAD